MRNVQLLAWQLMRIALVGIVCALAACQPASVQTDERTATTAPAPESVAAPEQPVMQSRAAMFEAMSRSAEAFTGAITLTAAPRASADAPPAMKLSGAKGLVLTTELVPGGAQQADRVDWAALFGSDVATAGNPERGAPSIDIHSVVKEDVPATATNGGYCGRAPTAFIAMATGLIVQGQSFMSIAAFKGDAWPPQSETDLCGTFNYAPPAAQ